MKFVFFLKSRLTFNIFYCFCMFVNKHFIYLRCVYSISKSKTVLGIIHLVRTQNFPQKLNFFICYLAAPWPILDHYRGDSLTHPMLITALFSFDAKGYRNEVGSLSPAECLVMFEPGTFRILSQRLNPLTSDSCNSLFFL